MGSELVVEYGTELFLAEGLARVEQQRTGSSLARVRLELRARESERVLDERRLNCIRDQRQRRVVAEREPQLCVEVVPLGIAMVPVSVGLKVRRADDIIGLTVVTLGLEGIALGVEGAVLRGAVVLPTRLRVLGKDRDHAAR